jgi:hypothetical protein
MTATPSPNDTPNTQPDAFTTRLQTTPARWPSFLLLAIVLAAAFAFGFLFLTGRLVLRPDPNSPEGKTLAFQSMAAKNVEFARVADSSVNKVSWDAARGKLIASQDLHRRLVESHTKLKADLKRLADGAEGKRVASRESWVDQFVLIQDSKRLTDDDIEAQLRAIKTLLPVCETALKEDLVVACDEPFRGRVDEIHDQLAKAVQRAEEDQMSIAVLISSSQAASPSSQSLSAAALARKEGQRTQALTKLSDDRERQRQELERAAREQQLASDRAIEEAKLAADQKVREANLAREKAEQALRILEANRQSQQASRDLKQAEDNRERERIRRERLAKFDAALPGVKALLTPFISNGRAHYVAGKGWREGEPAPLSLSAIASAGALKDQEGSTFALAAFCHGQPRQNDRPLGSFPETTFQTEREIRRAQTFLREYGDLLVERGMLLP